MTPAQPCAQASSRISPLRNQVAAKEKTVDEGIGSHTIMFGGGDGVARSWVNCKRLIQILEEEAIKILRSIFSYSGGLRTAQCFIRSGNAFGYHGRLRNYAGLRRGHHEPRLTGDACYIRRRTFSVYLVLFKPRAS